MFASLIIWKDTKHEMQKKSIYFSINRHEAMTDLTAILGSLVDVNGKILIPGIYDTVAPVTDDERKSYGPIDFDLVSVLYFSIFITLSQEGAIYYDAHFILLFIYCHKFSFQMILKVPLGQICWNLNPICHGS